MTQQREQGDFWAYCANGAACPGSKDGVGRRFMPLKRAAGSKSAALCSKCAVKADVLALTDDDSPSARTFNAAHKARILAGESKSDWVRGERSKAQALRGKVTEAQAPAQAPAPKKRSKRPAPKSA